MRVEGGNLSLSIKGNGILMMVSPEKFEEITQNENELVDSVVQSATAPF